MPMIDLVPRLRELGRIRTGNQVPTGSGKRRPNKLDTFRITTPSEALANAVQAVYDGKVEPWESPAGRQFEVITKADVLPIIIPSGESLSQWYEMWSGGGCQRRCDGRTEMLSDGPCLCPSDAGARRELAAKTVPEACKPTTRLNVVLPDIPDLGVFRLESHGYYAAVELAGASLFLSAASAAGMNIPAHLRLEQREKKVPGQPVNRYAVPVIEFTTVRIADLLNAGAGPMMLGEGIPPAHQLAPGSLVPAKPERVRQPRVERPALGPAPTVPDGADFGRRQPVAPAATAALPSPAAPQPTVDDHQVAPPREPETVAGWVLDDEGNAEPPPPPVKKSKEPPPPPLTQAELKVRIKESGVDLVAAEGVFHRRFPTADSLGSLDDDERGRYWHELAAVMAEEAATSVA
jgi:Recombination directionality factor-like